MDVYGNTPQDVVIDWDNIQIDGWGISEVLPEYISDDQASDNPIKKAADEPKNPNALRRKFHKLNCTNCGESGHNIRTCKGPINQRTGKTNQAQSVNRGGRPRTKGQCGRTSNMNTSNNNVNEFERPRGGGRGKGRGRGLVSAGGNPVVNGRTFTGACPYGRRGDGASGIANISNRHPTINNSPCSSRIVPSSMAFGQPFSNISMANTSNNQVIRKRTRFGEILFSTQESQSHPSTTPNARQTD